MKILFERVTDLSDIHPVAFGFGVFGAISILPGAFMLLALLLGFDATYFVIAYAFVIQLILLFTSEHTIHLLLPFLTSIISFVVMDFVYFAMILGSQVGMPAWAGLILSLLTEADVVFVTEIIGFVAALIAYVVVVFVRKIVRG